MPRIFTRPTKPRSKSSISQVPITSSWCKRALRPLTSTILRLEKHWKAGPVEPQDCTAIRLSDGAPRSTSRRSTRTVGDDASGSESPPDDPTWVPGKAAHKRVKHRYSGNGRTGRAGRSKVIARSPETERLRPGEFTIATPLVLGKGQGCPDVTEDKGDGVDGRTDGESGSGQCVRRKSSKRKPFHSLVEHVSSRDASDEYRDPAYLKIVHGIHNTWSAFLKMTSCNNTPHRGARSLLSISLDKVSEYAVHEQERLNNLEDKDEETDVADYMITELEAAYALSNQGWKPLKELARAHGIRLVCDAIRNKWISPMLSRLLISRAVEEHFYDGAEALISALLSISPAIRPPGRLDGNLFSLENNIALNTLDTYTIKTGRWGVLFRELEALVSRGVLPVEWMATDTTKSLMTNAIQAISSDNEYSVHSVRFIATVLEAAVELHGPCGRSSTAKTLEKVTKHARHSDPKSKDVRSTEEDARARSHEASCDEFVSTALSNTISSVLTVLCGAHLSRSASGQPGVSGSTHMKGLIDVVSTAVQHGIKLAGSTAYRSGLQSLRTGYILMADYILSYTETSGENTKMMRGQDKQRSYPVRETTLHNFESFLGRVSNRAELVTEFSLLVLQVSRCWGRARGEDGFTQVKRLTDALTPSSGSSRSKLEPFPMLQAILNKVAVEVALNFAELTCLRDHHAWALHVQETVTVTASVGGVCSGGEGGGSVPWTPSLALSARGFRWEDGIGEWVARSPVAERLRGPARAQGSMHSRTQTTPSSEESEEASVDEGSTPPSSVDGDAPLSEVESPLVSRGKRKSTPSEELCGGNKRQKQRDAGGRERLRRRRTVAGCGIYVDHEPEHEEESDEDDDWNSVLDREDGPASRIRSRSRSRNFRPGRSTTSGRRFTEFPTTTTSRRRRSGDRPHHDHVEVVVRAPGQATQTTTTTTTTTRTTEKSRQSTDFEIVVQAMGKPSQRHRRPGSAGGYPTRPDESTESSSDEEDDEDEDEDEDDVFVNAPVLRDMKRGMQDVKGLASLRRRGDGLRLLKGRRPARRTKEEVIPCSQEESEDELSFI